MFAQTPTNPSDAKPSPSPPIVGEETIEVSKSYVADAEKAFALVVDQRIALEKFLQERTISDIERKSAETLIKAIDELIKIKDLSISTLENIVKIQSSALTTFAGIVKKLEKVEAEKSGWQKFLNGVKEVLKGVTYILIGKGLS